MYVTEYDSPVGRLLLGSDGTALTGLWMEGQKYFGGTGKELMEKQAVSYTHLTLPTTERV